MTENHSWESLSDTDLAYTAGIVDGDGCISISKTKSRTCRAGYQIRLRVEVRSIDKSLIKWLYQCYGGYIGQVKVYSDRRCPLWAWAIASQQALVFLEKILPYLRMKKVQAKIAIRFQQRKRRGKHCSDRDRIWDKADYLLNIIANKTRNFVSQGIDGEKKLTWENLPDTDLAYVAGIMDGEGYIGILKVKNRASSLGYVMTLRVSIANTNKSLIKWLHQYYGGQIVRRKISFSKPIWVWSVASQMAFIFLKSILPYLRVKEAQAKLAIRFQQRKRRGRSLSSLSSKDKCWDEVDYWLMRNINAKRLSNKTQVFQME